jgi:uncharacterized Rmd1/YagE family protein
MPEVPESPGGNDSIVARAFDSAASFDLRAARESLVRQLNAKLLEANPLTLQCGPRKIVVLFEYGSAVFFNFEPQECERVLSLAAPYAQRPNKRVSTDNFTLYLTPRVKRPDGTEELTIREFNRDTAILVAVVLSRSVALEYYEGLVAGALAKLEETIGALANQGRIPHGENPLAKQVGLALMIEHELAYDLSVFDDPDIVWDGGKRMEQLYRDLKREFDLDDRIKVIQHKVSLISRWSTFVISRLEGHRARLLEWIIIILILSEILLVLFGKM